MILEFFAGLGAVSNTLNIKEKLLKPERRSESIEPIKDMYCSVFLEHYFPKLNFKSLDKHVLELTLSKQGDFTVPIKDLDWLLWGYRVKKIEPIGYSIPRLWSLPSQACILQLDIDDIFNSELSYSEYTGAQLRKSVSSICLQCTFANGHREIIAIPDSLKVALLYKYYTSKRLFGWHQFWLLHG
ncbi:hypothetical protein [Pseudoalteromonas piscicida]|uniref:hypothetical protein n=1 Tax=Pseudoalteromonas piscicida TaxID=43662 RepID=UPI0032BF2631